MNCLTPNCCARTRRPVPVDMESPTMASRVFRSVTVTSPFELAETCGCASVWLLITIVGALPPAPAEATPRLPSAPRRSGTIASGPLRQIGP